MFKTNKSYPSIQHPIGYPVIVMSTFHRNGDLRPLKFAFEDEYQVRYRYTVDKVISIKENGTIISFYCSYMDGQYQKRINLIYDIVLHKWVMA